MRIPNRFAAFALAALLVAAAVGACRRTVGSPRARSLRPTVILVSIDGFRWDYQGRMPTPNLDDLVARGVRARWLVPSFPTLTFPNHWTVVTGLFPEHHGVVGNAMLDPASGARFRLGDTLAVRDSRWFGGEPVWVTAQRQGQIAATYFWPGSEAAVGGVRPRYWKRFDDSVPGGARVGQVLAWLDLPAGERPTFLTLYFSDVDHAAHDHGPDSPELRAAVRGVDSLVGLLVAGLRDRRLLDEVNILVTSDHGMAATSPDRVVVLDDHLDPATVDVISLGTFVALRPRDGNADRVYRALVGASPHLTVYRRAEIPMRFHYRASARVPDIVAVAEEGWSVSTRAYFEANHERFAGGAHGYDNALASMRGIFIGAGPALRRGLVVEPFQNVHLYDLMCAILRLRPAPNDGDLDSVRVMLEE